MAAAAVTGAGLAASSASAEIVWGITQSQTLITWDSAAPNAILSGIALSGLQSNETIRGIDFRPATGELYALGSSSRLYTLNTGTGQATQIGGVLAPLLNGSNFGFDFNPVIDRIRVVSNANQNLVLNPITGAVQTVAPNVFFAAGDPNNGTDPNVISSAYTNNFAGAATTTLYGIDTNLDVLVTQVAATGSLSTIGSVGADLTEIGGFDISGVTGIAYACTQDATLSRSTFWTINLATGQGTMVGMIGAIGGGEVITAMTVAVPGPGALALATVGILGLGRRRRN